MHAELEEIQTELERATIGFSAQDWSWAPHNKWNSLLIVEHLLLSYMSTTLGLLKIIHSQKTNVSDITPRSYIAAFILTRLNYFPSGRSAAPQAQPKGRLAAGSLKQFHQALGTMNERLSSAESLFGAKMKILDHPDIGPLSVAEWRRFHRTHGFHHIRQIGDLARERKRLQRDERDF